MRVVEAAAGHARGGEFKFLNSMKSDINALRTHKIARFDEPKGKPAMFQGKSIDLLYLQLEISTTVICGWEQTQHWCKP